MTLQSPASDLALMESCAREAGALTRAYFGRVVKTWSKGQAGPVTEVDLKVDALLKEKLAAARPEYGWLSEETADSAARLEKERVWIVDPIDGTEAFIKGVPQYTVSIGLAEKGRVTAGAVYNPMTDEMFLGAEGVPATLNARLVRASERSVLEGAKLIGKPRTFNDKRWPVPWPKLQLDFRHSLAYRLALVAAGVFDGTLLLGYKSEWDIAGGAAIVQAAGGSITDTSGKPLVFNKREPQAIGAVASGRHLHAQLIERVQWLPHPSEWGNQGWARAAKEGAG
jgi:myo-inositol-1(or 4)-monophosphatase